MAVTDPDNELALNTTSRDASEDGHEDSSDNDAASNLYPALAVIPQPLALPVPVSSSHSCQRSEVDNSKDSEQTADMAQVPPQQHRLNILDLPMDILKEITKEVSYRCDECGRRRIRLTSSDHPYK
jgi:hypothetical protein